MPIWRRAGGAGQVTVNEETGSPIGIQYRTSAYTEDTNISVAMKIAYIAIYSPIFVIWDLIANGGFN